MATVWITYAWEDNKTGDVDYIAQELLATGVGVKLDRWNIVAGRRLWEQIEKFICDPSECDAWLFYATQNSLGSEKCKEEYAYALGRALDSRGASFPVIGCFPSGVDADLIPAGIKSRLYVDLRDPDWKERIRAAAEGRAASIQRPAIEPYAIEHHVLPPGSGKTLAIEVRPRAGSWSPFVGAVPAVESARVNLSIARGAAGRVPDGFVVLFNYFSGTTADGVWSFISSAAEATPTQSYYLLCDEMPTRILFGVFNGQPQFVAEWQRR